MAPFSNYNELLIILITEDKMNLRLQVIVFILKVINTIANFLDRTFGIKLKKINKESTLKGTHKIIIAIACLPHSLIKRKRTAL